MHMITKAIISVAGWGTRRLPITKAIEKCMLPVGNRPLVDYVVQGCINAGIKDIYFVISEGSTQLRQYYSNNETLNHYLIQSGKNDDIRLISTPEGINFHYIEQPAQGKYGTAVPIALAGHNIIDDESVVVLGGDDFIHNKDGSNEIERLIEATPEGGNAVLGATVSGDEAVKYGLIETSGDHEFVQIAEKKASNEQAALVNISKYVLNHDAIKLIMDFVKMDDHQGEYYITDAINQYVVGGGSIKVVEAKGEYLDGGTVEGWLHANRVVLGDLA